MEASLYIHVPFCQGSKCDYCDFYSIPVRAEDPWSSDPRLKNFTDKVLREGQKLLSNWKPDAVPTLYIGGGTPSVLGSSGIHALLSGINELIAEYAALPKEVTVEANPESADEAFLATARESGATRLSLGIQSFHAPSREAVHRGGQRCGAQDGSGISLHLKRAAEYFPGSLSVDLMSGLPFQDERVLLDDIGAALSYKPAHVSLYALTLEAGTPLGEKAMAPNADFLPGRDEADRLWLCGRDALEKAGYSQYEVSNFSQSGKESHHNIRYWRMLNWLALGPGASGTIIDDEACRGFRYTVPKLDNFATELHEEQLDSITLLKETLLMGFRYIEGPDEELFRRRFGRSIGECIPLTLNKWRDKGLFQKNKTALNKEGLLFLNAFLLDAFEELDN